MTVLETITRAAESAEREEKAGKPRTFAELKSQTTASCRRCGGPATHTISMTAAVLGKGKGSVVTQLPRAPVCEACGVEVFSVIKRALKS